MPPAVLSKLFETGLVDTVSTNEHLARHPLVVGCAAAPAWRQLWSWADLPRTQYLDARTKLVSELTGRKLTHPGVILHVAGIVLSAAKYEDYLLGPDVDVVKYFQTYLDDILSAGTLEPERDLFERLNAYAGLGYVNREAPEFQAIYAAVRHATFAAFSTHMQRAAPHLFDRLKASSEAYSSLHEYDVADGNFADAPILHHIDVNAFARLAVRDWAANGNLLSSLIARYEGDRRKGVLAEEHTWLEALRACLDTLAAAAEPPHKLLLENRIRFSNRCQRLALHPSA